MRDECPFPPPGFFVGVVARVGELGPKLLDQGFSGDPTRTVSAREVALGVSAAQVSRIGEDPGLELPGLRPLRPDDRGPQVCRGMRSPLGVAFSNVLGVPVSGE